MKRRLSIPGDVRDDPFKDLRRVRRRGAKLGVEVLQFDLLAPEVVAKAPKLALVILLTLFIVEAVLLDTLPHLRRVLV